MTGQSATILGPRRISNNATARPSLGAQLVEQGFGILQIGGIEAFGEPGIN
ncbi:MAG: hypothetical protein JO189_05020, partial [Deltaproteobacteria bacterium]|nr:hypothetical protein [Deltaproteobacteria bacterium]